MKKYFILFLSALFIINYSISLNADTSSDQMERLTPFLGKWKTLSVFQNSGLKAPGVLEYKWILGKKWMFIEFIGQHPKRNVLSAYGFFI